jgi:chromate transporter
MDKNKALKEVALLFFRLGSIAFGGPAAHLAMMEEEVVNKRKWMSKQRFLDLMGATNLIPGPNSTEMTMHCGHERAGWKGLVVAGFCFIFPAVLITGVFAYLYQEYGHLPNVSPFIYGIKPAVIAIILTAVLRLGKKAMKSVELGILGTIVVVACLFGLNEIVALFGGGAMGMLWYKIKITKGSTNGFVPLLVLQSAIPVLSVSSWKVFLVFLKVGALLYGSGYVLFAFLDAELVDAGWLSRQQLIDAVAVGQFTPGPVLSTATFVGWQLNGFWGALAATAGIFLPSFFFVALLNPLIAKIRKSDLLSTFLDAVNTAAVAVIVVVAIEMGKETLTDWRTVLIALLGLITVFWFKKVNAAFIVLGGALAGYVLQLF